MNVYIITQVDSDRNSTKQENGQRAEITKKQ